MPSGYPKQLPGRLDQSLESHAENNTDVIIFDTSNPRSVYNLVSPVMQEAISNVHPEYYKWSLKALEKNSKPEERDYQLRVAFWREYNEAQDKWKKALSLNMVIRGVCASDYFYKVVLKDPLKLAFILYPVVDMQAAMEEMLDLGLREMRKILKLPTMGKAGANMPVIREKIKVVALLQNRIQGSVIQRVALDQRVQGEIKNEGPKSLDMIQKEIKQIERLVRKQTSPKSLESSAEAVVELESEKDD